MVSGRNPATDATAKLYLRPAFGSTGAGTASPVTTATGAGQHRHPTWSPDRTMIAYAQGDNATANYDIYILDLTDPAATPQNITNSNNVTDDRPAWSPDGTRIAFDSENTDGSNQLNIKIYNVATGNTTNFTSTASGTYEHEPAWTPDSQTLYYGVGNFNVAGATDVVRQPADGSAGPSNIAAAPGVGEFQPSVSPDGDEICFTRGDFGQNNARVVVSLANGGAQTVLPGNNIAAAAGYNCTWSPDGTLIAYVIGTFNNGDLWIESSNLSMSTFLPLESTANRFDGNPDWAPDGRPQCADTRRGTKPNTPVAVPLECADTGPAYEQTSVRAYPDTAPSNGTVTPGTADPPQQVPASVTYTPNPGFVGTDSFKVQSFDEVSFGDRLGTVTISVGQCAGRAVTKVGTPGPNVLRGTRRRDVIAGLGGNDVIRGLGRRDFLCGGKGRDRLIGGRGGDRLFGGKGRDFLKGGRGKDRLRGGPGKDIRIQ